MTVDENKLPIKKETTDMKHSKGDVRGKARPVWYVHFEPQNLTSYSGLILFQHFFSLLGLKQRLWQCFRHLKANSIYGHHVILMLLIVHLIIGHRRLRDVDYYRDSAPRAGRSLRPGSRLVSTARSSARRSLSNCRAQVWSSPYRCRLSGSPNSKG